MTNEDAIILLKDCIRMFENGKDRTAEKALVYLEQHIEALNMSIKALEERSVGEWVFHKDYNESCIYGCNQCGNLSNIPGNFCPNCGAYMKKRSLGDLWLKGGKE